MLIPKRMFRGHDSQNNRGSLYILAHKHGPDGKVLWRPDSQEFAPSEIFIEKIEDWAETSLAKSITRYNEISVGKDTESLSVVQVSMNASPSFGLKNG